MKGYYQELVTDKSWQILQTLKIDVNFILIGGWAVYLYTKNLKSKDIDIIVDYQELDKIKKNFQLTKNDRLKKYEIKKEGIDIDIYLPYFSNLGLPVEKLVKEKEKVENFTVLKKEILLLTKLQAYLNRKTTIKGQKDKLDIISLLFLEDFNLRFLKEFAYKNNFKNFIAELIRLLKETNEAKELGYNQHYLSRKKKTVIKKL